MRIDIVIKDNLEATKGGRAALADAPYVKHRKVSWSDADDAAVLAHVAQHGPAEWARCAKAMGRGEESVKQRWCRHLKETDLGRAALASAPDATWHSWTGADDAAVLRHVAEHGSAKWALCAKAMGRTEPAVRLRWRRHLEGTDLGRAALDDVLRYL